jgi:hypothetical protein
LGHAAVGVGGESSSQVRIEPTDGRFQVALHLGHTLLLPAIVLRLRGEFCPFFHQSADDL